MSKVLKSIFLVACAVGLGASSAPVAVLTSGMTDMQILRALSVDVRGLHGKRTQGKDGYSVSYSAPPAEITITRSYVSGVTVIVERPSADAQIWNLGLPAKTNNSPEPTFDPAAH